MPERKKGVSARSLAVKGTVVKGRPGKRTKVISPFDAQIKALEKRVDKLVAGSSKAVKATGGALKKKAVAKPAKKKAAVKKAVAAKGVKARGVGLLRKRLDRIKKAAR